MPEGGRPTGRRERFAHGLELPLSAVGGLLSAEPAMRRPAGPRTLLCSYHPSQRNVFTGLLTAEMFDKLLARARELGA